MTPNIFLTNQVLQFRSWHPILKLSYSCSRNLTSWVNFNFVLHHTRTITRLDWRRSLNKISHSSQYNGRGALLILSLILSILIVSKSINHSLPTGYSSQIQASQRSTFAPILSDCISLLTFPFHLEAELYNPPRNILFHAWCCSIAFTKAAKMVMTLSFCHGDFNLHPDPRQALVVYGQYAEARRATGDQGIDFLSFPREVRDNIYSFIFVKPTFISSEYKFTKPFYRDAIAWRNLVFAGSCRQIWNESLRVYLIPNGFEFF